MGKKIEITKVTCRDEKSIIILAALLETSDSWTVISLYLEGFCKNIDGNIAALSELLSKQNENKTINKLEDFKFQDEDSIRRMAALLETADSWTVDKVSLEGASGQGEWTGVKGGVGKKI